MIHFTSKEDLVGALHPTDSENIEVSNVLWSKENTNTTNGPAEVLSMSPKFMFPSRTK